ncbi:hypothetical protein EHS25_002441 [Saitozyma podzolica]|uniref:AB hydrolase-1 domain-containing protein n=1 Tax=Saitozyma podzolica TaxID=1890683 RepID=A0A427YDU9_9TREE|nr:hypothetical protein EHS25_002441 [Saitozyma podzolica]
MYAAGASFAGLGLAAGGLWYFQRTLIYPAYAPSGSRQNVPKPTVVGLPYEDVTLTTPDNLRIKAYVIPARKHFVSTVELQQMGKEERKKRMDQEIESWAEEMGKEDAAEYARSRPTVIIFHANAGNMGHRVPLARKFNVDNRCNVFMLSYRGYGRSEGHPSEHGLKVDVETALEYISTHPLLGGTKIILYGQSLGGAVCLYAASTHPDLVSGVIVENTFFSLSTLIPLIMPQIPRFFLPILLTEHWDASKTLPLIPSSTPILMLSGKQDALVPQTQMITLRNLRGDGRCTWRELNGEHNDTCLTPEYWAEVKDWLTNEVGVDAVRTSGGSTDTEGIVEKDN